MLPHFVCEVASLFNVHVFVMVDVPAGMVTCCPMPSGQSRIAENDLDVLINLMLFHLRQVGEIMSSVASGLMRGQADIDPDCNCVIKARPHSSAFLERSNSIFMHASPPATVVVHWIFRIFSFDP